MSNVRSLVQRVHLKLERLWTDTDSMLEVMVTFAARGFVAWQQTYVYPEQLLEFAGRLREFPESASAEAALKTGSVDPSAHDWLRLRAYVTDGLGHCALEFAAATNGTPPASFSFQFSAPIEAASLNTLGERLAGWATSQEKEFLFEARGT